MLGLLAPSSSMLQVVHLISRSQCVHCKQHSNLDFAVQDTKGILMYSCKGIINPERLPLGLCAFFDISNRLRSRRPSLLLNSHRTAEVQPCSSLAASPSAWPAARVFLLHNSIDLSSLSSACISTLAAHSPPWHCFQLFDSPVARPTLLCCRAQVDRHSNRILQREIVRGARAYPSSFRRVSADYRLQGGFPKAMRLAQSGGRFRR
jgi:hypothetical protein